MAKKEKKNKISDSRGGGAKKHSFRKTVRGTKRTNKGDKNEKDEEVVETRAEYMSAISQPWRNFADKITGTSLIPFAKLFDTAAEHSFSDITDSVLMTVLILTLLALPIMLIVILVVAVGQFIPF